jgi:dehydrogenase/reductase SDR family member 12
MIHFSWNISIDKDLKEVFRFLSDFTNLVEWDPGIYSVEKLTSGKLSSGSEFLVKAKFFGNTIPMKYILKEFKDNELVVYRGETDTLIAIDRIGFSYEEGKTKISYEANFEFKGVYSLSEGLFKLLLSRTAEAAKEGMINALTKPISPKIIDPIAYKLLYPIPYHFSKAGYESLRKETCAITNDLTNKTALITGASSGIGFETALKLARLGANLILVSQNSSRLNSAKENIIHSTGNENIRIETVDLSLIKNTKSLAVKLLKELPSLDILVNNAGFLFNNREETVEGYDKSNALLLYSPFVLTELLFPILKKGKNPVVVNVVSGGLYTSKWTNEDIENKINYNGAKAYAKAKRGLLIASNHWSDKWKEHGIRSYSMHPGWSDTSAVRETLPLFYGITKSILRTPFEGADTVVYLSSNLDLLNTSGGLYLDRRLETEHIFDTVSSNEDIKILLNHLENLLID